MKSQPKNGFYTASYKTSEPVPFRPTGYAFPVLGKSLTVFHIFATKKAPLAVRSAGWAEAASVRVPAGRPVVMNGGARIYSALPRGFCATDISTEIVWDPLGSEPLGVFCKDLSVSAADQIVQWALDSSGQAGDAMRGFADANFARLKSLAADDTLATPSSWNMFVPTTDPRVVSLAPNPLNEQEAAAYEKLPKTITDRVVMDPSGRYLLAQFFTLDPDGVHFSAELRFYRTDGPAAESATLLATLDMTASLPAQLMISYLLLWQFKEANATPQLILANYLLGSYNNMLAGTAPNNPFYIMNGVLPTIFGEGLQPAIPMTWSFGLRLGKAA